jgi:hypothetical protein
MGETTVAREVGIYTVTPENAKVWLSGRAPNRKSSPRAINILSEAMTSGGFMFNGESIIFDWHGRLLDGQHRLEACVLSGVPFDTVVVSGVSPDAFRTIDQGYRRYLRHILDCLGEQRTSELASALSWLKMYEAKADTPRSPTSEEAELLLLEYPGVRDSIDRITHITGTKRVFMSRAVLIALDSIFRKVDDAESFDLLTRFITGDGLSKSDPRTCAFYRLRDRIIKDASDRGTKVPRDKVFLLAIKAWNYSRDKRIIDLLIYKSGEGKAGEPYPVAR